MPAPNRYNLSGPKEIFLTTLDTAIQSSDCVVLDASAFPSMGRIFSERSALSDAEKEFVFAVYGQLSALAASGKLCLYSGNDLIAHTGCESFLLRRRDSPFYRALLPHVQALQSVPQSELLEGVHHVAAVLENMLTYYAKAFDIEVPRKTIVKNISRTTATALHGSQSYTIITAEEAYLSLIDALFGVSVEAFGAYDGTSPIRDILRSPKLSIALCNLDSDNQPFEIVRDTKEGVPPHHRWIELNEGQQKGVFKNVGKLAEQFVYTHSAVNFARAIAAKTVQQDIPDVSVVCNDPPRQGYEKSLEAFVQASCYRRKQKHTPQRVAKEAMPKAGNLIYEQQKKPPYEKSLTADYLTASSRAQLKKELGYDPEGVTLERALLKRLMDLTGFKGRSVADTARECNFFDTFEMGTSHYFRYNERDVQKFLKVLAEKSQKGNLRKAC